MRPAIPYVVAALLFGIGVYGVLRRRHAILLLMAVELMLNAVSVILVTATTTVQATLAAAGVGTPYTGHVFALFIIVIAAAEIGVGLAIVLQLFRLRSSAALDTVPLSDPDPPPQVARATVDGPEPPATEVGAVPR